jgi:uncharacterized protein (TIGR00369 family)
MNPFLERLQDTSPFPHTHSLGLTFHEYIEETGKITFRLPYSDTIVGNPDTGVIHGGAITTLLDTCCGAAVAIMVSDESVCPTLDLRIDHMTAAQPGAAILGEAEVYRMTKSIAFIRGQAYEEGTGTVLANAVATFMLMEQQNKRFLRNLNADR